MERVQTMNPYAKREIYDQGSLVAYRTVTIVTWLLVVLLSLVYTIDDPLGAKTIQGQNDIYPSPFALNEFVVGFYWVILLLSQLAYVYSLFTNDVELVVKALNVGSHFITNNIFVSVFILLWVYGYFGIAEIFLCLNSLNLTSLYFRHYRMPFFAHLSVVAGPKGWNFVALFSNGAAMVDNHNVVARVFANVFIWSYLVYGYFFLGAFQDYAMGTVMVFLTTALAAQQYLLSAVSLQTIFAFVILGLLVVPTLLIILPRAFGKELRFSRNGDDEAYDERRPLLDGEWATP